MKPGDVFPVSTGYPYFLPSDIKPGTLAKLISFDHGYWLVEAKGRQFKVYVTQVESGWLFELNGRWLDENDPRVIAERKQTSLRSSPAYSSANGGCVNPPLGV